MNTIKRIQIKTVSDLRKISNYWKKLEKGKDMTAFQYFDWNCLLFEKWKSYHLNRWYSNCYIYLFFKNGEVTLIAPIIVKTKTLKNDILDFNKGVFFLGDNTYSDYLNFVYTDFDEDSVRNVIDRIRDDFNGFPIFLNKIAYDTELNTVLKKHYSCKSKIKAVSIKIYDSKEKYTMNLSKSTKQNIRTAKNRMKRDNLEYELEVINNTLPNPTINDLIQMHSKRVATIRDNEYKSLKSTKYKKRLLELYKHINKLEKKYDLVANSMKNSSNSVFIIVKLNGKIVSYLYGLKDSKSIHILHNCFDEKFAFYSPMICGSYDFIINECINNVNNIDYLDFTLGNEKYKYKLGGKETEVLNYVI